MLRRVPHCASAILLSCTPANDGVAPASVGALTSSARGEDRPVAAETAAAAAGDPLDCGPAKPPAVILTPPDAAPCSSQARALGVELEKAIRARYVADAPSNKLRLTWTCARTAPATLVYQRMDDLRVVLVRIRSSGDGGEALRVTSSAAGERPIIVERASLRASALRPLQDRLAALTTVTLTELKDPRELIRGGAIGTGGFWQSSIAVIDAEGRGVERASAGGISSDRQLEQLPLSLAERSIEADLDRAPWTPAPIDDDVRAFVAERWHASDVVVSNGAAFLLATVIRDAGTRSVLPEALFILEKIIALDGKIPEMSTGSILLEAIARITGRDLRVEGRPLIEAASAYLAACARGRRSSLP